MNRTEKERLVQELAEKMKEAGALLVVDYKGLTVDMMTKLRRGLREKGGELKVAKARLIRLAASQSEGMSDFAGMVKGQVGIIFTGDDVGAAAKVIKEVGKETEGALKFVSAFFDGQAFDAKGAEGLASLPTREVLLTRLAIAVKSPISGLAYALGGITTKLAVALKAVAEKEA